MSALADYYAAMTREKDASIPLLGGQAALAYQQAAQIAPDAAAKRDEQSAAAGLAGAQAASLTAKTPFEIAATKAATDQTIAATSTLAPKALSDLLTSRLQQNQLAQGSSMIDITKLLQGGLGGLSGFAKGGKVKAAGNPKAGKTDTILAGLTPGEAVLNKGAVEHYGNDVISHMNKMGLMRDKAHKEVQRGAKGSRGGKKAQKAA